MVLMCASILQPNKMDGHNDQPVDLENLSDVIEKFQRFADLPPIVLCSRYLNMNIVNEKLRKEIIQCRYL